MLGSILHEQLPTTLNRTDQVEERLRTYFVEQGYVPGDALPKEIELASALNVSRNVVREALSRLRMMGMIDSKKRRGMILTEPDILSGFDRTLNPHMLSADTLRQLFEFRLVLEIGMADLLFIRRKPADLDDLGRIVNREGEALNNAQRIDCDIQFHATLYRMTGNNTLLRFQKLLVPIFRFMVERDSSEDGFMVSGSVTHAGLLAILEHGDPASFREAMKRHLEFYMPAF